MVKKKKETIPILLVLFLLVILMTSCGLLKIEENVVKIEEEDVPGLLVIDNQLFCFALHQPDDLSSNSESFTFLSKISSNNNPDGNMGEIYEYGEDIAVFLNSHEQYYLYEPFDRCGRFSTGDGLSDEQYREYISEKDAVWSERLNTFLSRLRETDAFAFFSLIDQPIYIYDKEFPEEFLDGYEDPSWDHNKNSRIRLNEKDMAFTKSIQVSEKFFAEYDISVSSGEDFGAEDYIYDYETNIVPVLMGSKYSKYFKIGDALYGEFLTDNTTFIVKGFLKEGTKYWDDYTLKPLDRIIVLPVFITDNSLPFAKEHRLQQTRGMIITKKSFDDAENTYEKIRNESELGDWKLYILKPSLVG